MPQSFKVDLGAVIELLSRNLYSSPGVYLRELIQNATDAIAAREELTGMPAPRQVSISPVGVATESSPADEFAIIDYGIGIALNQVDTLLATVGASSKKNAIEAERHTYLGQFGIGLLSCFLVADLITVTSQSAAGGPAIKWVGKADGTYTVKELPEQIPVGTTVRFRPRSDAIGWVRPEQVVPLARRFAEFLPLQIEIATPRGAQLVSREFPWYTFGSYQAATRGGQPPKFGGVGIGAQFDVLRIQDVALGLDGVVFISTQPGRSSRTSKNRVYLNGMLVTDKDNSLVPPWAFFATAVVNSTMLTPTASREALVEDDVLRASKEKIGEAIATWLQNLAEADPERFDEFVEANQEELRLAITNPHDSGIVLARAVIPKLTVHTTAGPMRLENIIEQSPVIEYTPFLSQFQQLEKLCPPDRLIINGAYAGVQELLLTIPQLITELEVSRVSTGDVIEAMPSLSSADSAPIDRFIRRVEVALGESRSRIVVTQLPQADPPTIFLAGSYGERNQVIFNWNNRVVQQLAKIQDDVVATKAIQLLYVQAKMAINADNPTDRQLLTSALDDIIALAVEIGDHPHA